MGVPAAISPPWGPLSRPSSAFQFSNIREDKKQQEMAGLTEKDNLILRQVIAGVAGWPARCSGQERGSWQPLRG